MTKWVVVGPESGGRALCRCECGTERIVELSSIRRGRSRSCGKRGCHYRWSGDVRSFGSEAWANRRLALLNRTHRHSGIPPILDGSDVLQAIAKRSGGECEICGRGNGVLGQVLHIDHDHRTNKLRGMLCAECNHMLGKAHDDPDVLQAAALYLRRNK